MASTKQQEKTLSVTLTRSLLGRPEKHRRVARALGLKRTNHTVTHFDTDIIRGMINTISHLVTVGSAAAHQAKAHQPKESKV